MSRFAAGLGGGLGAIGGAVAGSYAGIALRGRMQRGDAEEAGMAIGAVLGATILAAIGAGSGDAPKQVGTSGVSEQLRQEWKL